MGAIGWLAGPCVASLQGPRPPRCSHLLSVNCSALFFRVSSALALRRVGVEDSYLVDSASSHMLVSKIKPCMSKYKQSIR